MKEWHRTVALIVLLVLALGILLWQQASYQSGFLNTL